MSEVELKIKEIKVRNGQKSRNGNFKETRIYFFHSGENILENLVARFDRPQKLYKTLLPEVYKASEINEDAKASWSQYAGCSCPCSPGFIIKGDRSGKDIYVTISAKENEEG